MLIVTSALLGVASMVLVLINPHTWQLCAWACIAAFVLLLIDTVVNGADVRRTLRQAEQIAQEDQVTS